MKSLIKPIAVAIAIIIFANSFLNAQSFIDNPVQFDTKDSLHQLQKNYPVVYKHLLHEFKNVSSLFYTVKGNILFISFVNGNHKIFTVYSVNGEFSHSIADLGLELPNTVSEQIRKQYPAYAVYYGKEIRTNEKNTYQVVIENKYEYRLINLLDTGIEEIKRLKK